MHKQYRNNSSSKSRATVLFGHFLSHQTSECGIRAIACSKFCLDCGHSFYQVTDSPPKVVIQCPVSTLIYMATDGFEVFTIMCVTQGIYSDFTHGKSTIGSGRAQLCNYNICSFRQVSLQLRHFIAPYSSSVLSLITPLISTPP